MLSRSNTKETKMDSEGVGIPKQGSIYTLVQSRTDSIAIKNEKQLIKGDGTDIYNTSALLKKTQRKVISQKMILSLIDIANSKGDDERVNSYWNTFYCQDKLIGFGDTLHGDYCKNRFCTVCLANRKAENINKYYPVLKEWENPHFVTLTVKSVKAISLNKWIEGMIRAFQLIKDRCNKRYKRGKGKKLIGLKSLECNFNAKQKTYNPHFHIIVPNKATAELLKKEWMIQWTTKHTYHKGQHIVEVYDLEKALIETIKYGSKIFTEPDIKKKGEKGVPHMIYAHALDNIFCAMKGKRIFERFGFNLPQQPKKENKTRHVSSYQEWIFDHNQTDWYNTKTGERLTGYVTPFELDYLLNDCVDNKTF